MAALFPLDSALSQLSVGVLMLLAPVYVIATALRTMGQKDLPTQDRKLIGRYMLVGVVLLLAIGAGIAAIGSRSEASHSTALPQARLQNSATCAPSSCIPVLLYKYSVPWLAVMESHHVG